MSNYIFKDKYIHKVLRNDNVRENGGYSYKSPSRTLIRLKIHTAGKGIRDAESRKSHGSTAVSRRKAS